jgi:hypothetical protein
VLFLQRRKILPAFNYCSSIFVISDARRSRNDCSLTPLAAKIRAARDLRNDKRESNRCALPICRWPSASTSSAARVRTFLDSSVLLAVEMFAGRANFLRAFRNLTQRIPRKATEGTEGPRENKDEYRTERERLISPWFSVILCVLCVALFGIQHGEQRQRCRESRAKQITRRAFFV